MRKPFQLLFSLTALLVTACDRTLPAPLPATGPGDAPRNGGRLTVAANGDLATLDPAVVNGGVATSPLQLIYAGLVDYDRSGALVPSLAERFTVRADGLEVAVVLRPGSRFHDGSEVTADDVVRTFERALAKETPNPNAGFFAPLVGFEAYTTGKARHLEGVRATGRYTVSFFLSEPTPTFPFLLAMHSARPVCPGGGRTVEDRFAPCGAGPFKLPPGGWEKGQKIRLVKHEGYFRAGLPHLDEVQYLLGVPVHTQLSKFEVGDVDLLRDLRQSDALRFQTDPRWKPFGDFEAEMQMGGEAMNTELPPFNDVRVRRAVAAAIDREEIQKVRASNLSVLTQPVPHGVAGRTDKPRCQSYDPARAKALLREAGHPDGFAETIPYYVYPQSLSEGTSQILQQQLARIGIHLELRMVSFPAYMAITHRAKTAAISPQGWVADYPESGDFLEPLFHSRAINPEDSNNSAFYANPELDALLDKARTTVEPTTRAALYNQAEQRICDDAPWAFTFGFRYYDVRQPYVRGYTPHPYWFFDVTEAWLDRSARPGEGPGKLGMARPPTFGAPSNGPHPYQRWARPFATASKFPGGGVARDGGPTSTGARPFATASKFPGGGVARDGGPTSTGARPFATGARRRP